MRKKNSSRQNVKNCLFFQIRFRVFLGEEIYSAAGASSAFAAASASALAAAASAFFFATASAFA